MDADEARSIGLRVRQIRDARGKSLRVIAGLAGMSTTKLWRTEHGEHALDSLSEIVALANALQIAPGELMRLAGAGTGQRDHRQRCGGGAQCAGGGRPRPARRAGCSVGRVAGQGHGDAERSLQLSAGQRGRRGAVGSDPGSAHQHRGRARRAHLLELAVLLHSGATLGWLRVAGASRDLRAQAAQLVHQAAQRRDSPAALGLATWGGLYVLVSAGEFDLAQAELDSVTVPTNSPESMQVAGMLARCRSFLAAASGRPGDVDGPLDHAAELAERTGQGNAYWMGFGPQETGQWRARIALETGDYERAAAIAEGLYPESHPLRGRHAMYWVNYGQALARMRGRHDDAVMALLRAEKISPRHVHRNPFAREMIAGLLTRSRRDSPAGRELRSMACRAGLPSVAQPGDTG